MINKINYIIITPARDEAQYIEMTLKAVVKQSIKPDTWIIVNDGSSDQTGEIVDSYAGKYDWIKTIHRENRGFRQAGGGVIETFYDGYNRFSNNDWEFIVKLDGDLSFSEDYFENCFKFFDKEERLGIGGGTIADLLNGEFIPDNTNPLFHVRGATKIYRRKCWEDINGLIMAPGWDTLDEVKANMFGWKTRSFQDLIIRHYRPTGGAEGSWKNWVKNGKANYICGYHPLFMFMKCMKRMMQRPFLIASMGLFYGFISGYKERIPQIEDKHLIDYLRKQQLNRLLGKRTIWE